MKRHFSSVAVLSSFICLAGSGGLHAQSQTPSLAAPTIFQMTGTLKTATGEPRTGVVVLVASLYSAYDDVMSLWSEAQTVTLSETGRYSILVGSTVEGGVPKDYFLGGAGRWLGVAVQGEADQPRVMLISVPYALKAVDADRLAGKTAADFVLAETFGSSVKDVLKGGTATDAPLIATTTNMLAKFTDGVGTVGNSTLSESGGSFYLPGLLVTSGFGTHLFSASGTGANRLQLTNPTAGAGNNVLFRGDTDVAEAFYMRGTSSTYTAGGTTPRAGADIGSSGAGGLSLSAGHSSGAIRFYTGGSTQRMSLSSGGMLSVTGGLNIGGGVSFGGVLNVSGFGEHTFSASGTGANRLQLTNPTAGPANNVLFRGDTDIAEIFSLRGTSSIYAGAGSTPQAGAELYTSGSGGMSITAGNASGAVRFYAGGSAERMRIDTAGNVGIGTATPTAKLDVNGNINVTGNINAKYQDVAEWVETSTPLEPGTVVIVDPTGPNRVLASSKAYDTRVAGAVSKQPGLILGEAGDTKAMVAQSGRVRIKVDARYGAIRVGDLLVTSPAPGYAMRSRPVMVGGVAVHRAGTLLGKALEAWPTGKGEILVLLTLQ